MDAAVPLPDTDEPMLAHLVCGTCHPANPPVGATAVCGAQVLGIAENGGPRCAVCVHIEPLAPWPCGH